MKNCLQAAFILHSKPYKEHSALVDLFTHQGRFRGVLRKARNKMGSVCRPFMLIEVSLQGKNELKTITHMEPLKAPHLVSGNTLFSGLYLNELLVRLLPLEDPYPALFEHYQATLLALAEQSPLEPLLRSFEWTLLCELGYSFPLDMSATGEPINPEAHYCFKVDHGLEQVTATQLQTGTFLGADLLAMSQADWSVKSALQAAKRLMRQAIAVHLQGRPLISRELFK